MVYKKSDVMLSVCMITYNHEKYVEEAIKSVLDQSIRFKMELVIGEDCSSDKTLEICEKYSNEFPDLINLLPSIKNWGVANNFLRTYNACTGKYIAILEGDDYWTDINKLQKQVNFMESNTNYSMCFSKVHIKKERKTDIIYYQIPKTDKIDFNDIVFAHYIPTLTLVLRNIVDLPIWIAKVKSCDRAIAMLFSSLGPVKYFDEIMGVYRVHEGGITNTIKQNEAINDDAYFIFKKLLNHVNIIQKFTLIYVISKNRVAKYLRAIGVMKN